MVCHACDYDFLHGIVSVFCRYVATRRLFSQSGDVVCGLNSCPGRRWRIRWANDAGSASCGSLEPEMNGNMTFFNMPTAYVSFKARSEAEKLPSRNHYYATLQFTMYNLYSITMWISAHTLTFIYLYKTYLSICILILMCIF